MAKAESRICIITAGGAGVSWFSDERGDQEGVVLLFNWGGTLKGKLVVSNSVENLLYREIGTR